MSTDTSQLIYRACGGALIAGWFVFLCGQRRWRRVVITETLAHVPEHDSLAQFFHEASILPATSLIVPFGAVLLAGQRFNSTLAVIWLIGPALLSLWLVLFHLPHMRVSVRARTCLRELARFEGVSVEELAAPVSLPGLRYKAPLRTRLDFEDGSFMAWSAVPVYAGPKDLRHEQLFIWCDVRGEGPAYNLYSGQRWQPRGPGASELLAEAVRRAEEEEPSAVKRLFVVTLRNDELTVAAKPPEDLSDCRKLLRVARALRKHVRTLGEGAAKSACDRGADAR